MVRAESGNERAEDVQVAGCRDRLWRPIRGVGRWVLRNRLGLALASLLWLLFRSGSNPKRLSYPCQQVAAFNVGAFLAGLGPALFLLRCRDHGSRQPMRLAFGRQAVAGVALFLAALLSIEGFQYAASITSDGENWPEVTESGTTPTFVGIVRQAPSGGSYTLQEIKDMVAEAIELAGGLEDLMVDRTGDQIVKVVIKPNLVQAQWDATKGVVTDPRVCAGVAEAAWLAGADQVMIAEGTADGTGGRDCTWEAFAKAGYDTNRDRLFDYDTNVTLGDLNNTGGTNVINPGLVDWVSVPNGVIRTGYYVPKILTGCDVLISVPTFKNHNEGTITLGIKNHVGCAPNDIYHYPGLQQMKWSLVHRTDQGFPATVPPSPSSDPETVQRTAVDLNLARPHDFVVIDALIGVTNGPHGGGNPSAVQNPSPRRQMIIAGSDTLAVDTVGTLAMGYNPSSVMQLSWGDFTGALGTTDRRYITVLGDHVQAVRYNFPDGYGGATRADQSAPWIGGINLGNGQEVSGTVTITGSSVGDNQGVIKAELIVDGEYVATDITAPYSFEWDSTTVADGPHTVTMIVYDNYLNESSITRSIVVSQPPAAVGILSWASVREHVSVGELAISLDATAEMSGSATTEPRRDGVQKIVVDFDGDAGASYTPGQVAVTGGLTVVGEALVNSGTRLEIEFAGSADGGCYAIDISASVAVDGDADCLVASLEGDTNNDQDANFIDLSQVKSLAGQSATSNPRADYNTDGDINFIDVAAVKSLAGASVVCP